MSLFQSLIGNNTAIDPQAVRTEFADILLDDETVDRAFKTMRDVIMLTNHRLITIDKLGLTGSKQHVVSIPYRSIKKFSVESAGLLDADAELRVWITGDAEPKKWEFSKRSVDIRAVYKVLSFHVLTTH